jgi:hypothetical protein
MDASTLAKSFNFLAFPQLVRHFGTEDWSRWNEGEVPVRIALIRAQDELQVLHLPGQGRGGGSEGLAERPQVALPALSTSGPDPTIILLQDVHLSAAAA